MQVRHQVIVNSSNDEGLDSARLIVINSGFGTAKNVLIHVNAQYGQIVDYRIDSQELHELKTVDLENGVIDIWLDRFASGARVQIELTGRGFLTNTILVSAVSDQGASIPADAMTFSGQVDTYTNKVVELYDEATRYISETPAVTKFKNWVLTNSTFAEWYHTIGSSEFQTVALAASILILLILIFVPDGCLVVLGVPFITGFVVWAFFDFPLPTWITIAALTILAVGVFYIFCWKRKGILNGVV